MPDDAPEGGTPGEDEEIWFGDDPESATGNGDGADGNGTDEADELPSAVGGSKGRMIVGLVILLFGVAVAAAAISQRDSGETTSSGSDKQEATAETTKPEGSATTTEPVRTPTTIPGGALPTGCGDWDGTFGFEPEPIEGVAVWSDFNGWHIRVAPDGPPLVTGTVVGQVVPVLPENQFRPGGVEVSADPATATVVFSITPGLQPTGFDFAADCAQKQLTFQFWGPDGEPLPADQVQVGRNGTTTEMPFVAQRTMPAG